MRLLGVLAVAAAVAAIVAWPVAQLIAGTAVEVQQIRALDEAAVTANRLLWSEGDDVAEIYGAKEGAPLPLLFLDEDRLVRPAEDPSLVLYAKTAGENPIQARLVTYLGRLVAIGTGTAALALALVAGLLRARRRMRAVAA